MKRLTLLSTFCLLLAGISVVQAQDGERDSKPAASRFYLKAGGGYFFSVSQGQFPDVGPYPPHDLHQSYNPADGSTTPVSEKVLTGSYGAGARGGLTFGWNISQYIAVEGTFNYYHSKKNLMTREVTTLSGSGQTLGSVESHGYVNAVDFAPSVVFSPGHTDKVNPYVRFGVVVPLWGRLYIETDASRTSPVPGQPATIVSQTTIQRKEEIKPNATIGFQGALGVIIPVSRRLDVFVETEYRNVPVKGKEKEVTEYEANVNVVNTTNGNVISNQHRGINDLTPAERHTEYVTTLDQQSNTEVGQDGLVTAYKDQNRPSNELKSYINIGGLGINAGLRIRL